MSINPQINLIIADDHEVYRDGLKLMLSKEADIEIVGEASNGLELVNEVNRHQPDVILTDIVMPTLDGIEAVRQVHHINPAIGIIALSMFNEENYIVDMLEAGALGYLIKNANKREILNAIRTVYKGDPYYCTSTSSKLTQIISKSSFNPYKNKKLLWFTEKELEIIELICKEKTNKDIGEKLFLSTRTVEGYRLKIQEKLNVRSTVGLVVYAIKTGIYKIQ